MRGAADTRGELFEHHRRGGHVPVLLTHPRDRIPALGGIDHPLAVVDGGAQRLLDEHVLVGGERIGEHRRMGEVR